MLNGEEYTGNLFHKFSSDQIAEFNLGTEGVYPTITSAIADAELRGVGGAVRFLLVDATYPSETFPIVIGEINGVSSTNTITLSPDVGVTSTIEGSINLPIFDLSGASYFIFDGRQGGVGTDNALNITNTSTTASSSCIRFINGATNNTVQYVNLTAIASSSTTRAVDFGTSASNPSGNSNNLITNCDINSGRYCVYFSGTAANPNVNNTISNSKLYNGTFAIFYMLSNAANTTIAYNEMYNDTAQVTANSAISMSASALGGVNNIIGNKIYDIQNTATTSVRGITGTPGDGSTLNIVNNFISLAQIMEQNQPVFMQYKFQELPNIPLMYITILSGLVVYIPAVQRVLLFPVVWLKAIQVLLQHLMLKIISASMNE
jgi:trimeric autotransporter adhesin